MAQKYNPLLELGFQEVSTGGGGGSTFSDFISGTYTALNIAGYPAYYGTGVNTSANALQGMFKRIYSSLTIDAVAVSINSLGSSTGNGIICVYKYNQDNNNFDKILESSQFAIGVGGVAGYNTLSLSDPITLEAGIYFVAFNSQISSQFKSGGNNDQIGGQSAITQPNTYASFSRYGFGFGSLPATLPNIMTDSSWTKSGNPVPAIWFRVA
jgi:hypothetical protein